jgi:hypothetical protein
MVVDDDSSELSSLSSLSPAPSDDELDDAIDDATSKSKQGILSYFPKLSEAPPKEPSPPPRKRSPSPPHEYVLADNPDIAVCTRLLLAFSDVLCAFLGSGVTPSSCVRAVPRVTREMSRRSVHDTLVAAV